MAFAPAASGDFAPLFRRGFAARFPAGFAPDPAVFDFNPGADRWMLLAMIGYNDRP